MLQIEKILEKKSTEKNNVSKRIMVINLLTILIVTNVFHIINWTIVEIKKFVSKVKIFITCHEINQPTKASKMITDIALKELSDNFYKQLGERIPTWPVGIQM